MGLDRSHGVPVVGTVPQGLPALGLPAWDWGSVQALWLPALLISLVGFVESVSVAQSLALKRQQRIEPNRELLGLGAANLASAVSGAFQSPVGLPARSSILLPVPTHRWQASSRRADGAGGGFHRLVPCTAPGRAGGHHHRGGDWSHRLGHAARGLALRQGRCAVADRHRVGGDGAGVEAGILLGVALSLGTLVWRSSHPHMAVVGRVPGTEHFRNVDRHQVVTEPGLVAVRVDESLYFANASVLQDRIEALVHANPAARHVLLVCSAVNQIDATALGVLGDLERSLRERGIRFCWPRSRAR